MDVHCFVSLLALAAAPPPSAGFQRFRPLKQSHTGAQLSRTILEFILSIADGRATWLQVAQRSLLEARRAALA